MSKNPTVNDKAVETTKTKTQDSAVYVRSVNGPLLHLFTNTVFTGDPKKTTIDGFLQAQLDAGKLEIVSI